MFNIRWVLDNVSRTRYIIHGLCDIQKTALQNLSICFLNIFDSIGHKFFCWNFPHYLSCLNFFCFLALSSPIPLFEGLRRNLFRYHNKTLVIDNLCPFFFILYREQLLFSFMVFYLLWSTLLLSSRRSCFQISLPSKWAAWPCFLCWKKLQLT